MQVFLAIAAGGAIGAMLRHFLNEAAAQYLGTAFPWGIFIANILGSFAMGCLVAGLAHIAEAPQALKAFLAVGVLGAFTTFSTFSLDAAVLIGRGALWEAAAYIVGSVLLAIAGLYAGIALVRVLAA